MAFPIIVPVLAVLGIGLVALASKKKSTTTPSGTAPSGVPLTKGDPGPYRILPRSEAMKTVPKLATLWASMMPGAPMPSGDDPALDAKVKEAATVGTIALIAVQNTKSGQSFLKGAKITGIESTSLGPIYVASIDNAGAKAAEKGAELFVDEGGPADGTVVKFGPPQVIEL